MHAKLVRPYEPRLSVESAQGAVAVQRANEMQEQYDQLCHTQRILALFWAFLLSVSFSFRYSLQLFIQKFLGTR